jgi:N-formylglutamate amidohydrolase
MPSFGRLGERRADVVPGTRGRTTAGSAYLLTTERVAARFGLEVRHDDPYRGGHTTVRHGRPQAGRHALQIELARRLYMDETTLARSGPGLAQTRAFCAALVEELGQTLPG